MTSDEEIQKQIDELTAQERQRWCRGRFILKTTILGGMLAGLAVPTLVFLDIPGLSLATGIGQVDSMLSSMGGGPIVIVLAAMIWSIPGAIAGFALGSLATAIRRST